ncbi:MAG: ribosome small subunit-dependent GTPase A, partial [Myxococcales bacterium]
PPRIEAVLPRRSQLVRQAAGRRTEPQVMAANVDVVLLVAAAGGELNLRRVERYLAAIRGSGAEPVVVINKTDLVEDEATLRAELAATAAEVPVLAVSAKTGAGFEQLRALLAPGRTMVVVGSSGVGKSTIVNRLRGAERQATGDVREDDQKGRHTTTTRHLLPVPLEGGHRAVLIDTPGLRELQLWADTSEADAAFAEIQALAAHCRFADCTHEREPGCAVREAVARGELAAERLESLRKLERERAKQALRQDARGRQEEHRQGKRTGKVLREIERFNPKRKK